MENHRRFWPMFWPGVDGRPLPVGESGPLREQLVARITR